MTATHPIVITGPSCSGKTTLQRAICAAYPHLTRRVISYTTRPRRPDEVDGIDYHFFQPEAYRLLPDRIYEHRGTTGRYCLRARDLEPIPGDPGRVPVVVLDLKAAEQCYTDGAAFVVGLYWGARRLLERKRARDGVAHQAEAASIRRQCVAAWRMYEARDHVHAAFFSACPGPDDIAEIWRNYGLWRSELAGEDA